MNEERKGRVQALNLKARDGERKWVLFLQGQRKGCISINESKDWDNDGLWNI